MGSKGTRFAFVMVLIVVAVGVGYYFYPRPSTESVLDLSTPSQTNTSYDDTGNGNKISGQPENNGSNTTDKPKASPYPAGVTPVPKVTSNMKGSVVTVRGYAIKMTSGKGHHFYIFRDIVEPGCIKAVVFKAESENQVVDAPMKNSLNAGTPVTITGKVDVYKGELEIIIDKASE